MLFPKRAGDLSDDEHERDSDQCTGALFSEHGKKTVAGSMRIDERGGKDHRQSQADHEKSGPQQQVVVEGLDVEQLANSDPRGNGPGPDGRFGWVLGQSPALPPQGLLGPDHE